MILALSLTGCGGDGGGTPTPLPDITPPTVVSTAPDDAATDVAVNTAVSVTFSENMNCGSLTASTFTLAAGMSTVAGVVNCSGAATTFTPGAQLATNTVYTATVTTGVTDPAGNAMAADHVWNFTTGITGDTTAPAITATMPADGATGVPVDAVITATFSEDMDAVSIDDATFVVSDGIANIPGAVTYNASTDTATFDPEFQLVESTSYTATITTGVSDLAGNNLPGDEVWTFTTGGDTLPPSAVATVPADGATGASLGGPIYISFDEPVDYTTITVGLTCSTTGAVTTSVVGFDSATNTADLSLSATLADGENCTATMVPGVEDLASVPNATASPHAWSFSPSFPAMTGAPTVPASATSGEDVEVVVPVTGNVMHLELYWCVEATMSCYMADVFSNEPGNTSMTVQAPSNPLYDGNYYPAVVVHDGANAALYAYDGAVSTNNYYEELNFGGTRTDSGIAIPLVAFTPPPNLVVSIDGVTADGANVSIDYTVNNVGAGDAGAFGVEFWVNEAAPPVVGDTGDDSEGFVGLLAGGSISGTIVIANTATLGTAYAIVDSANAVQEYNEDDNVASLQWPLYGFDEGTLQGWSATGLWHVATTRYSSAPNSVWYSDGADYDTGVANSGELTSPAVPLTGDYSLNFEYFLVNECGSGNVCSVDRLTVEASADGGITWDQLAVLPATNVFANHSVGLSAYSGQTVQIRFRFDTVDSSNNAYEGAYVDNVRIVPGAWYEDADGTAHASSDVPQPITDLTLTDSTVAVSGDTASIAHVRVCLDITHTYDGDLEITLESPTGTVVELTSDNGGTGENLTNTCFDDDAFYSITQRSAPFAGMYRPEGQLADFIGEDANGAWTLHVYDDMGGDIGTLNAWSIFIW